MIEPLPSNPEVVKSCCANLYEHPLVKQLLGDSFHPGGTALTKRLCDMMRIDRSQRVLDVATGRGTSAIFIAKTFGCRVMGIDLSERNIDIACQEAAKNGVDHLANFVQGDAESIPFDDECFNAVLCECALCTFPNKPKALSEFRRVLVKGGRLGISDLTKNGRLSSDLDGLLSWVSCIADALPPVAYLELMQGEGLCLACDYVAVDEAMAEMAANIEKNLIGAKLFKGLGKFALPDSIDLDEAVRVAEAAREAIKEKKLGYGLFIGVKPDMA